MNVGTATVTIKAKDNNTHSLDPTSTKEVAFRIVAASSCGSGEGGPLAPNTGDEIPLALYGTLAVLCLAGLTAVACKPRKKNK